MLGRRVLVGAVVTAILGIVACVNDETVDLTSIKDAGGSAAEAAAEGGGSNNPNTICGDLTHSPKPTCPDEQAGADPTCGFEGNAGKNYCCPGNACSKDPMCADKAPVFECFTSSQCDSNTCCVAVEPEAMANPDCGYPYTIKLGSDQGSTCSCTGASTVRLCTSGIECSNDQNCTSVRILIPNPNHAGDFARVVRACIKKS